MSLFFKERTDEQNKNCSPAKDMIRFCYPWIITIPPLNDTEDANDELSFDQKFQTAHNFYTATWDINLSTEDITVSTSTDTSETGEQILVRFSKYSYMISQKCRRVWDGRCYISYTLYYDNEMRFVYYSSPRILATLSQCSETFSSPHDSMTKFSDVVSKKKILKMVIFVELELPAKNFYRPFDMPLYKFDKYACKKYPEDMENDSSFKFLKESHDNIKCLDGLVCCSSAVLKDIFGKRERVMDHLIDVVKPIIIFIHSDCFQMPESYNLDYAARLLNAIDFFDFVLESMIESIHQSLCQKFVQEKPDFDTLLKWISIAGRHSLELLQTMTTTVMATKFYHKWHQTFPEIERNPSNPRYREVFGTEEHPWIFKAVEDLIKESFNTKVILD